MIISDHQQNGGKGGIRGKGGAGGSGGMGGRGGNSYTWSENVRNYDGSYSLQYHTNPGGSSGSSGLSGSSGQNGNEGRNGQNGYYLIHVSKEGYEVKFNERYWITVLDFERIRSDDNINEPGEELAIRNVKIFNSGQMPTPYYQGIFTSILSKGMIRFNQLDQKQIPKELNYNQVFILEDLLKYEIAPYSRPTNNGIFMEINKLTPINTVQRVNKDFGQSFSREIQIRWPIETSNIVGVKTISFQEEAPFAFEIRNISSVGVGHKASIPRNLEFTIDQVVLLKNDKQFEEVNSENKDKIQLKFEDGEFQLLSLGYHSKLNLNEHDSFKFGGTLRFLDEETLPYTKIRIQVSLFLGPRNELEKANLIQTRTFDLQLAEEINFESKADFFLIVNSSVNRDQIEHWRIFASQLKLKMLVWNISLYNGFSYSFAFEDGKSIGKEFQNKVVIFLNNDFDD